MDVLSLNQDAPVPEPDPGTLHLEVVAAGIGLPDVFMCEGSYHLTPGTFPFTQGQEVVGRVLDWGDGVENRRVGERVMAVTHFFTGNGGYAEQCLSIDDFSLSVPDDMPDAQASGFLIAFHTAHIALVARGKIEAGETLLVLGGAGGTGQAAIQIGKALGARVIATAGSPERAEFCRSLGADHVIDHRAQDIAEGVKAATDGRGVEAVYDPVGGEAFASATQCIAPEGRILAIGFASGSWGSADTSHIVYNNYSLIGVIPTFYDRAFKLRTQDQLLAWWKEGKLSPQVEDLVPFETLPEALERLVAGGVRGKLALAVDPKATR
jgi:NADPH2:quinone reductase